MIRNQIFQVANKIYRGVPLFPMQENKVRVNNTWDDIRIIIKSDMFNSKFAGSQIVNQTMDTDQAIANYY